ncbi:hypothetical protein ACKF11_13235 [Methylobacillus sp. Pita2]|uniref:hypothetical protein n=1 Tax=Methylobacillus sp. Pita2 TaxID=3383245 RepID=UPI0038B668CA
MMVRDANTPPKWTKNARQKAQERFPGVDLDSKYVLAKRVGQHSKFRKQIKLLCPGPYARWMADGFAGRYYKVTRERIVFVVEQPETILTVFQMPDPSPGKKSE